MVHITPSGPKGVVFIINGDAPNVNASIFGCGAFASGVAAMEIPEEVGTKLLSDATRFKSSLTNLRDAISSENANADLVIGPGLDTDAGKDVEAWKAGFDGTSCAVGIYSAHVPVGLPGRTHPSKQYFLVAKAGAGAAAATFHQRLMAQLKTGVPMNDAMKTVGSFARVISSGQRNRARLLAEAAKVLRIDHLLSTLTDVLSCPGDRALSALPTYDCSANTLRQTPTGWLFHSGCIDGKLNSSVIVASNVSEGFVLFVAPETSANRKLSVRNDLGDAVPAGSRRRITNMELASQIRSRIIDDTDADYNARFAWSQPTTMSKLVPPPGLLGSHSCEETTASWARELGLASMRRVALFPELVTIASWRPSVLRSLQEA